MVSTPIELLHDEPDMNLTQTKKSSKLFCSLGANLQKQQEKQQKQQQHPQHMISTSSYQQQTQADRDLKYLNSLVCDDEINSLCSSGEGNSLTDKLSTKEKKAMSLSR